MSSTIKQAIESLKSRIADAYIAIVAKGGTLSLTQDSANLPAAIASIPSGSTQVILDATYGISFYSSNALNNSKASVVQTPKKVIGGAGRREWSSFFEGYWATDFPDCSELDTRDGESFFRFYGASRVSGRSLPKIRISNKCKRIEQMCYSNYSRNAGLDTSEWDCSGVINCKNFVLYSDIQTLIGSHTLQEVEEGQIRAMSGLRISINLGEGKDSMPYSSFLAFALGVADMTGETSPSVTFAAIAWNNMNNDDGTTPDAATIATRQNMIDNILTSKNWIRA